MEYRTTTRLETNERRSCFNNDESNELEYEMSLDVVMDLYVALEDYDECLESIVAGFDDDDEVMITTPSGREIACCGKPPFSDVPPEKREVLFKKLKCEFITVTISEGEYHLYQEFGDSFAKITLSWVSPYSISNEQYEDLLNYIDPGVECVRTIGLPGEMAPLVRGADGQVIVDNRRAIKPQTFANIDEEAKAWFAAV